MPRPLALSVLTAALVAGCGMSHGAGEDSGPGGLDASAPCDCDAGPVFVGDGGRGSDPDTGPPLDGNIRFPDARPPDGGPIGDRLGDVWEGYVESTTFPSGSDAVRIVFDSASGDGPRTGYVVFGEGELGPVTDPSVGYPEGYSIGGTMPIEGFRYPIVSGSIAGDRILITIARNDVWFEWCAAQTSYEHPQDSGESYYNCLPPADGTGSRDGTCILDVVGSGSIVVDCGWMELCGGPYCTCTATGCMRGDGLGTIRFDLSITADRADGSADVDGLRNVHVTRR